MIFKLQRPLGFLGNSPYCLVYNEDRSVVREMLFEDMDAIFGNELKVYVEGKIGASRETPSFEIIKHVQGQDW